MKRSWERDEHTNLGQFDLWNNDQEPPKLLEFNADTLISLVEASVLPWFWMQNLHAGNFWEDGWSMATPAASAYEKTHNPLRATPADLSRIFFRLNQTNQKTFLFDHSPTSFSPSPDPGESPVPGLPACGGQHLVRWGFATKYCRCHPGESASGKKSPETDFGRDNHLH